MRLAASFRYGQPRAFEDLAGNRDVLELGTIGLAPDVELHRPLEAGIVDSCEVIDGRRAGVRLQVAERELRCFIRQNRLPHTVDEKVVDEVLIATLRHVLLKVHGSHPRLGDVEEQCQYAADDQRIFEVPLRVHLTPPILASESRDTRKL